MSLGTIFAPCAVERVGRGREVEGEGWDEELPDTACPVSMDSGDTSLGGDSGERLPSGSACSTHFLIRLCFFRLAVEHPSTEVQRSTPSP